jgi:hypothetical protein
MKWDARFLKVQGFRLFQVSRKMTVLVTEARQEQAPDSGQPLALQDQLELQLAQNLQAAEGIPANTTANRHYSQVFSWLDTTQWPHYLQRHDLLQAAQLIEIPKAYPTPAVGVGDGNATPRIFDKTRRYGPGTPAPRPIRHGGSNEANRIAMRPVVHELYINLY